MHSKNIVNLVLICLGVFVTGVSLTLLAPFYPSEALKKGVSVTQSGVVMSTVFIATIVFTPLFGKYMRTLGARHFLVIGAFFVGVGNGGMGFLDYINSGNVFFGLSIFIRIVTAIGESSLTPAAFTLAGQQVTEENQGKATALAESCFGIGTMFGPTIGGFLFDVGGFPLPFWISGGFSLVLSIICYFFLNDIHSISDDVEESDRDVRWSEIILSPGVPISIFAMVCAGTGWQWYSPSLDPWLMETFGLTASQTGLVFMAFGMTYTVFTSVFGYLTDRGMGGLVSMLTGNLCIFVTFVLLGPMPPLTDLLGNILPLTVTALAIQGIGSAATYIGSLLFMLKGVSEAGLPDNEQTRGMVSSLWVLSDSIGGYLGDTLGSLAYDKFGFEDGSVIMAVIMVLSVGLILIYLLCMKFLSRDKHEASQEERKGLLSTA